MAEMDAPSLKDKLISEIKPKRSWLFGSPIAIHMEDYSYHIHSATEIAVGLQGFTPHEYVENTPDQVGFDCNKLAKDVFCRSGSGTYHRKH
jgi:hypothetical protein